MVLDLDNHIKLLNMQLVSSKKLVRTSDGVKHNAMNCPSLVGQNETRNMKQQRLLRLGRVKTILLEDRH